MADTDGRPVEVHITTVSSTDRDAMPLITSMAYGERYAASSLNMAYKGIVKPGIFSGFIPTAPGGLEVTLTVDPETGFGLAAIDVDNMQLRVFQQHDIKLTLTTGVKSHIVLEAFFEEGVSTTQVDSSSTQEAAWIKVYADGSQPSDAIVLCTVDLTGGETEITSDMLDLSNRSVSGLDWQIHENAANPHPQYMTDTETTTAVNAILMEFLNNELLAGVINNIAASIASAALTAHLEATDPHSQYTTNSEVSTAIANAIASFASGSTLSGLLTNILNSANSTSAGNLAAHTSASDPHSQYMTSAETTASVNSGIAAHISASDPHSQYMTSAETTASVNSGIAAHISASDPHSQYMTSTETNSAISTMLTSYTNSTTLKNAIESHYRQYIESSASMTLTRSAVRTFINRLTTADATITINPTLYTAGDTIIINNAARDAGIVTLVVTGGYVIDYDGVPGTSHTISGNGFVELIKLSTSNLFRVV